MNVCLVAPVPPPYGGIANWTNLIKRYLVNTAENISLSIVNTAPKVRITEKRTLWDRIVMSGFRMIKQKRKVIQTLRNHNVDVVHITTSGSLSIIRDIYLMMCIKKRKIPIVYHIRFGRVPFIANEGSFEWRCMRQALQLADRIIAIDEETRQVLQDKLPNKYVDYIPNPINMKELPFPLDKSQKTILFLGWVIKAKGIEELLSAWGSIYSQYMEWDLKIVGPIDPDYRKYLEKHFCMDNVHFLGEKEHEEALTLLNNSEIFVLPSHTEGFPNVILEAMALRKSIIASNVGAVSDILSEGCGVLVKAGDVSSLTHELELLLGSCELRKRMGERAYVKVKSRYDINIIIREYIKIWEGRENAIS